MSKKLCESKKEENGKHVCKKCGRRGKKKNICKIEK